MPMTRTQRAATLARFERRALLRDVLLASALFLAGLVLAAWAMP